MTKLRLMILPVVLVSLLLLPEISDDKDQQAKAKVESKLAVEAKAKLVAKAQEHDNALKSIMSLGGSVIQAQYVLDAAEEHNISYKVLASLIYSESEFKQCHHADPDWVGLAGINAPVWKGSCPYNPYSDKGNINAAAWILGYYLEMAKGNYLEALTHYKGYSPLGRKYARRVLDLRYKHFKG